MRQVVSTKKLSPKKQQKVPQDRWVKIKIPQKVKTLTYGNQHFILGFFSVTDFIRRT